MVHIYFALQLFILSIVIRTYSRNKISELLQFFFSFKVDVGKVQLTFFQSEYIYFDYISKNIVSVFFLHAVCRLVIIIILVDLNLRTLISAAYFIVIERTLAILKVTIRCATLVSLIITANFWPVYELLECEYLAKFRGIYYACLI